MDFDNKKLDEEEILTRYVEKLQGNNNYFSFDSKSDKRNGCYLHKENGIWIADQYFGGTVRKTYKFTNLYNLSFWCINQIYNGKLDLRDFPKRLARGTRVVIGKRGLFNRCNDYIYGTIVEIPKKVIDNAYYMVEDDNGNKYKCVWFMSNISNIYTHMICNEIGVGCYIRTMEDYIITLTDEMTLEEAGIMNGDIVDIRDYKEAIKEINDYKNEYCDKDSSKTK